MGYGVDILNNIRLNNSEDYQTRVPVATRENFSSVGNAIQSYTTLVNEFCEGLFNKIGLSKIEQKLFENKLAKYKTGTVNTQQDVEEIFIEMAKAEGAYDKHGKNPLGRRLPPDVKSVYHRMNRQDYYATTIGDIDFVRVFKDEASFERFVKGFITSIYSGANYDEWLHVKKLLGSYDGYFDYGVTPITAENTATATKDFVKTLRKAVNDLSFASTKYNKAGVKTWTEAGQLTLFVHKDVIAELDVEVLSKAFNMGKTDIQVDIEVMDDFGDLENTYALLVDKDFFRIFDTLSRMETQRNAQGLFTNYFYHVHQILSLSPFKNAVRFTTATVTE